MKGDKKNRRSSNILRANRNNYTQRVSKDSKEKYFDQPRNPIRRVNKHLNLRLPGGDRNLIYTNQDRRNAVGQRNNIKNGRFGKVIKKNRFFG